MCETLFVKLSEVPLVLASVIISGCPTENSQVLGTISNSVFSILLKSTVNRINAQAATQATFTMRLDFMLTLLLRHGAGRVLGMQQERNRAVA